MTVGEKIKRIRKFRGLTQKELGVAIGLDEKTADVRIAQYETAYRVPKKDSLIKMAAVLKADLSNFYMESPGSAKDIIQMFFRLDEDNSAALQSVSQFMREWLYQKKALEAGEITQEEYFEWKINWSPQEGEGTNDSVGDRLACIGSGAHFGDEQGASRDYEVEG